MRVAIIGSGPSAFYAADALLKQHPAVEVDMFERLHSPFGLVRLGVAPDHQKIKSVTRAFEQTASNPRFRFFGLVEFGTHLGIEDIRRHYHQVLFATGAQSDRRMGIPGEELGGSHSATSFVAWYNGHPDLRDASFELDAEAAVVVGVGNVALDVARILCLAPGELGRTDMADYAIEALSRSRVRDVYVVGRRGPAQAAFTLPELKELGELEDADVVVHADEAALDRESAADLETAGDATLRRKIDLIQAYAARPLTGKRRRIHLRFLLSPLELEGAGCVERVVLERNELARSEAGTLSPRGTGQRETIAAGLVFRAVGYRGVPLAGVPFHEKWGLIRNESGRVANPEDGECVPGEYVAGWIKRGPSGVIGTNKPDAAETVACMLADAADGLTFTPEEPSREAVVALLRHRQPAFITFADWRRLDELECAAGQECGRPRVKFTSAGDALRALGRS
ncbi:MAG: FAD-dependent oxidoreductase [Dehalococcoidia bacterium]|nr:FAD-dependent oxidoreductase [Dehalococcoidia bacterium]